MVHIFVLIIPHNRTVSAWEPISQGRQKAGEEAVRPLPGGRWRIWPQGLSRPGTSSVVKVIRLPF